MRKPDAGSQVSPVYLSSLLTKKISMNMNEIGKNVKQNLERTISRDIDGRCITEGYIRPGSVKVLNYSSGTVENNMVMFETVFECMICHPVEGMNIECISRTITKAGVHAEVVDEFGNIPVTVFIARDHHFTDKHFVELKENMNIVVKVIGLRFELNDPSVCVIAQLLENGAKLY